VTTDSDDTAVRASIEDAGDAGSRADAQVRTVLGRVMAQRRSAGTALDYVRELAPGVTANCWAWRRRPAPASLDQIIPALQALKSDGPGDGPR
jgi:hypothetical protein